MTTSEVYFPRDIKINWKTIFSLLNIADLILERESYSNLDFNINDNIYFSNQFQSLLTQNTN